MRRKALAIAAGTVLVAMLATTQTGSAAGQNDDNRGTEKYSIALIGDMPYAATGRAQFPAVINEINSDPHIRFTIFDGDIKNGKERCDQWQYDLAVQNFASFSRPLVYLPGDNEWTDCDRASNGSYDPNERLALLRRTFFAAPVSLGQHPLDLTRQSAAYPENVRWQYGPVTYAGLNIPGSDNNAPQFDATGKQVDGDLAEYTARNAANIEWLTAAFAAARSAGSKALVITVQADMWSAADPTAHYADTKTALARLSIGFPGQVILVNGDSHYLQIDKPLKDAAAQTIENVTRVQTFGSDQNHWVSADIDPNSPEVISFHQHIVPGNVPAYTAP